MINRRKKFKKTFQSGIAGCLAFPSIESIASEIANKENLGTDQGNNTKHHLFPDRSTTLGCIGCVKSND